ncbi:MAG TPA: M14 family metallopeptidase [Bacteroidales bacterium]|nr:M14 family metallopeptidase [Bacteroidales bacterium]
MKTITGVILILHISIISLFSQGNLITVAEKSGFKSTSEHRDVLEFIESLTKMSKNIRVENIGKTSEGRDIPLLVIGNPLPSSSESIKNDSRIVVYIQCNIHAGEVEGKEASLMFARDLLKSEDPEILKNAVILICPNFNPDGNDRISPGNRTNQKGPVNGVGVRHNGQYLDLNRDALKAESPEVRGLLMNVFNRWDPQVFMDCHTTNGSYHSEPVTFTWMVNPNGDKELISYMHDRMMPAMSQNLLKRYKVENCFYGEFFDMLNPLKGWVMEASEPRYMTNYYGIRNRLAILNENYVYADFKSRVWGCYYLIQSLCDYINDNKDDIRELISESDKKTISRGNDAVVDSFAIEYEVRPAGREVTIQTYEAEMTGEVNGWKSYKNTGRPKTVTVPYYVDFVPVKSVALPSAYLLTVSDKEVLDLIINHGIKLESLLTETEIEVDRFEITELKGSQWLNQGHYFNSVKGKFVHETKSFPAGTVVIRMNQPLSNVSAYLLEPQSGEGLLAWNFFDRYLVPQWGMGFLPYPVYKVMDKYDYATSPMN